MIVLGIDPGGRATGLCLVEHSTRTVLVFGVLDRPKWSNEADWRKDNIAAVTELVEHRTNGGHHVELAGVEGWTVPNPHVRRANGNSLINPKGIIDTAFIVGALLTALDHSPVPRTVLVPPGGNGSNPAAAYPPELIGPKEGPALGGRLRHARSAFDVAMTAVTLSRYNRA